MDSINLNNVPTKTVEIFGAPTCQLPPLLYGNIGHITFLLPMDNLILTCGGEIGFFQGFSRSCFAYDKLKGNWTLHSSFATKRIHAISITMENSVYVLGGITSSKTSEILESGSKTWIEGPEIHPLIRWSCNDYSGPSNINTGPNKCIGWKISLNLPSSLKLTRQAIPILPINIATLF